MASRESDNLTKIISRRRRKILNDGIFELNDEDRNSPIDFEKYNTSITNKYTCNTIPPAVSETTLTEPPILNTDFENSVESGELNSTDSELNINKINELKSENGRLARELEALASKKCNCNMTIEGPEPKKPLFTVSFRDRDTVVKYKEDVLKFLHKLVNCSSRKECKESDLEINLWENESDSSDIEFQDLFIVDSDPAILQNNANIPYYKNVSKKTISENERKKNSNSSSPKYKDRIQPPRNQYSKNSFSKTSRYHQEEKFIDRFSNFKPGKISEKLRYALGLRRYELPRHIYKMRIWGYPPGWLDEAMSQKSGLKLFTEKNVDENSHSSFITADMIHEYPGFNMPLGRETKDEYLCFKSPPFQYSQTKESILKMLPNSSKNSDSNKNSSRINVAVSSTDMDIDNCSLEENTSDVNIIHIEDIKSSEKNIPEEKHSSTPPLPTESYLNDIPPTPIPPPPPPPSESDEVPLKHIQIDSSEELSLNSVDQNSLSSYATSLSLSDLETQKRLLLSELQKEGIDKSNLPSDLENQDLNALENNESITNLHESSLNEKNNIDTCTQNINDSVILLSPNIPVIDLTTPIKSNCLAKNRLSSTPSEKDINFSIDSNNLVHNTSLQNNLPCNNIPLPEECNNIQLSEECNNITLPVECSSIPLPGESSNNENNITPQTKCNVSSQIGAVKFMLKGTPILKSVSPYSKLPDQRKFAKDMGPLLNYENLPDAIGKYEKMKDLIKKVRVCYKQILDKY